MNDFTIIGKYLLLGFLLALIVHLNPFTGCNKEDVGPEYPDTGLDLARPKRTPKNCKRPFMMEITKPSTK